MSDIEQDIIDNADIQDDIEKYFNQTSGTTLFLNKLSAPAFQPVPHEEEEKLCLAKDAGDQLALRALATHNIQWALNRARNHQNKGLEIDDLFQLAVEGTLRAAKTYDYKKGKMTTHMPQWIGQTIDKDASQNKGLPLPKYAYTNLNRCLLARHILSEANEKNPSHEDIADMANKIYATNVLNRDDKIENPTQQQIADKIDFIKTTKNVVQIVDKSMVSDLLGAHEGRMDNEIRTNDDGDTNDLIDSMASSVPMGSNELANFFNSETAEKILHRLRDETERKIIDLFYGLGIEHPELYQVEHSIEEIGDKLGLTKSQTRSRKGHAIEKLQRLIAEKDCEMSSAEDFSSPEI